MMIFLNFVSFLLLYAFSFHFQIGEISKKWTGLGEEMFTDADNFGVSFPVDLDIKVKIIWDCVILILNFDPESDP